MRTSPALEEIMESFGAQGSDCAHFISNARVGYRIRRSKIKNGQRDILLISSGIYIWYHRIDIEKMLSGISVVVYNPQDPPRDIIQRTLHLQNMDELKFSDIKCDKKKRKLYVTISAKRDSMIYRGGGRVYLTLRGEDFNTMLLTWTKRVSSK
ncbi:hypothetical protein PHOBOS_109 [Erwinia phage vB_EamM_Phobos]|uniref:hypothetical protein n=1 Tax=Erwinia phage vB_EamM_Phobos TaxID=1883377 RepID=UPI00081CE5EC|nr:hypothetical protein BIZ79_gp109 [Erwinia phage vB_EamM_Phobos]ANZ50299.1 hypothetical protein PHOBOS_109 [Erwinia phage vB_EamM_Phobos]